MAASVKHLANDGATQITTKAWADIFVSTVAATGTAEKFFVENNGDRALVNLEARLTQVGSNDGVTRLRIGADVATVVQPYGFAAALSGSGAGGTWGSVGLRYYRMTAVNALGQTTASAEISINVDDVTKKVNLSWTAVAAATGYRVYRSAAQGVYVNALAASVSGGGSTAFADSGAATSAGSPPSANTTGGAGPSYGSPPTLGAGPLSVGGLAIGQQFVYWLNRIVPPLATEAGNPRVGRVEFVES